MYITLARVQNCHFGNFSIFQLFRFLGENMARQSCFRFYLTFSRVKVQNIKKAKIMLMIAIELPLDGHTL